MFALSQIVDGLNRRALLEQVQADFAWQQKVKTKEVRENDPFARRPCQPMPLGLMAKKDPGAVEPPPKKEKAAVVKEAVTPTKPDPKDDIYSVHNDVDIDLDIDESGRCSFFPLGLRSNFDCG